MSFIQHLPVLSVMGCFLGAFLVEIFGSKNKAVRLVISFLFVGFAFVSVAILFKPVMIDGNVISYWMGNWEPVSGFAIGIGYEIDRLSYFFAMVTVVIMLMSTIYSVRYMEKDAHLAHYYTLFLMLSGGVLGMVLTGDIFNMFVMIEIMTFAAVALTAFRTGRKGPIEAAFKYLVIGSLGAAFTLLGIGLLYRQCHTLNMAQLSSALHGNMTPTVVLALAFMFVGMGIESYIVPFHTPAVDSYTEAPAPISMAFAGMLNKAGIYGMIRLLYIIFRSMDRNAVLIMLVVFGCVTMFIGVTMALVQHDLKKLLAYHSVSQVGYIIVAIGLGTWMGLTGGLYHALNHTLFKGLLFLVAGAFGYAAGTTNIDKLGGLSKKMPKTTVCFLIGAFSISGLPPFNGFMSKWQIYMATYQKGMETGNFFYVVVVAVAVVVSVMTLASFIKVAQAAFFGQAPEMCVGVKEVPLSMRLPMWIMAGLCVVTGLLQKPLIEKILAPTALSALKPDVYINTMMGEGYAETAGVVAGSNMMSFNMLDPVLWLVLFVTILFAVFVVVISGTGRKKNYVAPDDRTATFFGGEAYSHSHVGGSDMFWGLKKNWRGYFGFMDKQHSGILTDYTRWVVVSLALVIIFLFIVYLLG